MPDRHRIKNQIYYLHVEYHRDGSQQKSQWIISKTKERDSFELMLNNNWMEETAGWGLHLDGDDIDYLGESASGNQKLIIAKFKDDNAQDEWHGYPANHIENTHDRPEREILLEWKEEGYINPAQMRKILKQQPCNP